MDGLCLKPALNGMGGAFFDDMSYFWVRILGVRRISFVMLRMTTVCTVGAGLQVFSLLHGGTLAYRHPTQAIQLLQSVTHKLHSANFRKQHTIIEDPACLRP